MKNHIDGSYFSGTLYVARMYNRALLENEVKANYNYDNKKYNINDKYYEIQEITENKYTIASVEELEKFRDEVNSGKDFSNIYVEMTNNIDLSEVTSWTPIGTETIGFNGIFDGNGYSIKNLKIDNGSSYQGLFGNNAGIIENVKIESGAIKGIFKIGAIAGVNTGNILKCINNARIEAAEYHVGGIAGYNTGYIQRCSNNGEIISDGTSLGGIVGRSDEGLIKLCSNMNEIKSTSSSLGGIVGLLSGGTVSTCYNTANITTTGYNSGYNSHIGGIAGYGELPNNNTVKYCYNTGDITGAGSSVGGIIGTSQGYVSYCYNEGDITAERGSSNNNSYAGGIVGVMGDSSKKISYCYNIGSVKCLAGTKYASGITGYNGGNVSNAYTLSTVISSTIGKNQGTTSNVSAKTEANMKTSDFITLLGGNTYWYLDGEFPKLSWE